MTSARDGRVAAEAALAAEAVEAERRRLADRWLDLPGNEGLRFHAADISGVWYARKLASGLDSHGMIPWKDLKRALGVRE